MLRLSRRHFLATSILTAACTSTARFTDDNTEKFVCPPCGCSMDGVDFDAPGQCPDCGMALIPKMEHQLGFEPAQLLPRAGIFELAGGVGREQSRIKVHYYMPDGFTADSNILLVIPGAGRNSDSYRNAWIDTARRNNVLVAALGYSEESYDFAAYHLGGVVKNLSFDNLVRERTERSTVIFLRDEDIKFDPNPNSEEWLFNDFDRVFNFLVSVTGSTRKSYDIFGHSAGGQILHRFALLHANSRANRIIAANAGFYTLPDLQTPLFTGVKDAGATQESLKNALALNLIILLGEDDNDDQAGGVFLHTPLVDEQGLGRLSRGRNFYQAGFALARALDVPFRWKIETAPGVGHDHIGMGRAAARILYR